MSSQISATTFNHFFAWAPLVVGVVIYAGLYAAKRHEVAAGGAPIGQTFACASCGRRGHREHMLPQEHGGATCWYCTALPA